MGVGHLFMVDVLLFRDARGRGGRGFSQRRRDMFSLFGLGIRRHALFLKRMGSVDWDQWICIVEYVAFGLVWCDVVVLLFVVDH